MKYLLSTFLFVLSSLDTAESMGTQDPLITLHELRFRKECLLTQARYGHYSKSINDQVRLLKHQIHVLQETLPKSTKTPLEDQYICEDEYACFSSTWMDKPTISLHSVQNFLALYGYIRHTITNTSTQTTKIVYCLNPNHYSTSKTIIAEIILRKNGTIDFYTSSFVLPGNFYINIKNPEALPLSEILDSSEDEEIPTPQKRIEP